jgi:hypothetical protein
MTLSKLSVQGWRKTGYWLLSCTAITLGAWRMHGTFTEYRDGMIALAGLVLTAHVVQQKVSPSVKDVP